MKIYKINNRLFKGLKLQNFGLNKDNSSEMMRLFSLTIVHYLTLYFKQCAKRLILSRWVSYSLL